MHEKWKDISRVTAPSLKVSGRCYVAYFERDFCITTDLTFFVGNFWANGPILYPKIWIAEPIPIAERGWMEGGI